VRGFTVSSRLASPPAAVWEVVTSPEGVNHELWPIVRMTVPRGFSGGLRTGSLGRSWILLLGVLPIDYDDLSLASIDPRRGFSERSTMASCAAWHHDRTLLSLPGGGCRVVDQIGFSPRLPGFGGLMELTFEATFRWRHRRLRARFGAAQVPPS
jgi:ligand-binding SRPBCC domain-containing protein